MKNKVVSLELMSLGQVGMVSNKIKFSKHILSPTEKL